MSSSNCPEAHPARRSSETHGAPRAHFDCRSRSPRVRAAAGGSPEPDLAESSRTRGGRPGRRPRSARSLPRRAERTRARPVPARARRLGWPPRHPGRRRARPRRARARAHRSGGDRSRSPRASRAAVHATRLATARRSASRVRSTAPAQRPSDGDQAEHQALQPAHRARCSGGAHGATRCASRSTPSLVLRFRARARVTGTPSTLLSGWGRCGGPRGRGRSCPRRRPCRSRLRRRRTWDPRRRPQAAPRPTALWGRRRCAR
jgi:hypothetical protein